MVEHILDWLFTNVGTIIASIGYLGVFLLMAAESANIPIPSEAIMPFAGYASARGDLQFVGVVISGVLGNWAGSSLSWWLGATGGRALVEKYGRYIHINHRHLDHAERWFRRYGERSVLIGRLLPIVRTFISLPAGLARMNYGKFSLYTVLGSLPFCFVLTMIGFKLGKDWENIRQYFHYLDFVVVIGLVIALVYYWHHRRRR